MNLINKLDIWHAKARSNKWLHIFTLFNRIALAFGFIAAGLVKIVGERFASGLAVEHPMGAYLEALHHTGYYYTFIGVAQILAGLLLLIPRTATLGALLYFPIIVNISVLSFAVRFDGSLLTSPLMVLANVYLLCWDYHKLKFIFPFSHTTSLTPVPSWKEMSWKFPMKFAIGCIGIVAITIFTVFNLYQVKPYNSLTDCQKQCSQQNNPAICLTFCECIHVQGNDLDDCLNNYEVK